MPFFDIDSLDHKTPEAMELAYRLIGRASARYFRAEVRGAAEVPDGPVLYVGNHSGGLMTPDTFVLYTALYEAKGFDAVPYGLAHEIILQTPLANAIVVPLGAIRASHANAHRVFARGAKALVYPGGDVDALRPYRHRNRVVFDGRMGYIRLALRAGVPIVPVVTAGSHATFIVIDDLKWLVKRLPFLRPLRTKVWPITLSIPWGLTFGPPLVYLPYPTRMLMEILPAIHLSPTGPASAEDDTYVRECADRVEGLMQSTLERLAKERDP